MARKMITVDGNMAAAIVAHATNEVIAIYPITPSSPMGEHADEFSAEGRKNIYGTIPIVTEMQSEGGASAAVHGSLTTGALCTTFTASQGLLLMIPSMYKIAGELCSTVFHVSARSLACQALSIFGDHSDVMTVRETGFGLLASNNVQEVHDFALIAQAASLESQIPFVHFFDGFRTSNEIMKIEELNIDDMQAMIEDEYVFAHRMRGMNPERPILKGTSQNPDVYFQGRETVNPFYLKCPDIVQKNMDKFAQIVGRQYHLFDYVGAPDAEAIVIMMASGAEAMHEVIEHLVQKGDKVGLLKVRLYRPFSLEHFAKSLPETVKAISVLDRTKEPGSLGEPLYLDIRTALGEGMEQGLLKLKKYPVTIGGRYGLGSKDFTGAMAKAVVDNVQKEVPKNHFTIGINDDVTHTSLDFDPAYNSEPSGVNRAMFYGLGADGTVSANKNTIKIIAKTTDYNAQAYFVYDSKKAGAITTSHLRFGKQPIHSTYLIDTADFVACHNWSFLEKYDMLHHINQGGTFLLASPYDQDEVWDKIPIEVQEQIISKKLKFYVIDAIRIAKDLGLGARINVIMQTAHFVISGIIDEDQAMELIKQSVIDTYGSKGEKVINMNINAAEAAVKGIQAVDYPQQVTSTYNRPPIVPEHAPTFVHEVTAEIIAGRGDDLPVSKMPCDGAFPTATTQYEKRNIAIDIPVWDTETCTQCGYCSLICPHATIRLKVFDPKYLEGAPPTFKSVDAKGKQYKGMKYSLQVAPEDCTGCACCVHMCPAQKKDEQGDKTAEKAIRMESQVPLREQERENYDFFLKIPEVDVDLFKPNTIKGSQFLRPLFEYSGACSGCGETPYVKLLSQLFGDRAIMGNATGCSSIYGGNLPTTPFCTRNDGRGPTWNNSLFEDCAELAFGMRLASDKHRDYAQELVRKMADCSCEACAQNQDLFNDLLSNDQSTLPLIEKQRQNVVKLKKVLADCHDEVEAQRLISVADALIKRSVWGIGGDGWAYDIGYGGLDHVLANNRNVNLLVLDTEVYSNTGGQASKATPMGAVAKFAAAGKPMGKKDLGMISMTYGHIYVAQVAMGANLNQTVKAFVEAEAYDGPSIIIAYCQCIAHGINMETGFDNQKKAVQSGHFPLYRYNPELAKQGKNPLKLDSKEPSIDIAEYMYMENRFRVLKKTHPDIAESLLQEARRRAKAKYCLYDQLAKISMQDKGGETK
ncbi:pyruvate:ferredoxin (flavodoxin) oxidoreductase [candidate division CSSED10-310 bacterium]|uniref:Pyruvate:ferredoxin (Flavodoxin) oxidoreductase n=1 Tax=candidate division CSSED10-310 bacterium TaxID=2855610 RepID=A0ABV6YTP1_UNCC1